MRTKFTISKIKTISDALHQYYEYNSDLIKSKIRQYRAENKDLIQTRKMQIYEKQRNYYDKNVDFTIERKRISNKQKTSSCENRK